MGLVLALRMQVSVILFQKILYPSYRRFAHNVVSKWQRGEEQWEQEHNLGEDHLEMDSEAHQEMDTEAHQEMVDMKMAHQAMVDMIRAHQDMVDMKMAHHPMMDMAIMYHKEIDPVLEDALEDVKIIEDSKMMNMVIETDILEKRADLHKMKADSRDNNPINR